MADKGQFGKHSKINEISVAQPEKIQGPRCKEGFQVHLGNQIDNTRRDMKMTECNHMKFSKDLLKIISGTLGAH